ncbi:PKD domain-containing protein [Psychroserpens sp.]|uniref:PKD domain-containing protein n=1 Tax=Psychroserpens sp. TaxID=2020870 RepID=UPI00385EAA0A
MKKFIKINKIIWLFIITPLFFGCEDDDDAASEKAVAGFVHTINQDNGMVTFLNLSENADSYSWDFGDGTSSTLINPEKIYENGTYTIVLESSNASGSSDTFQDEITILIPEIISIPITFDGENTNYDAATFGGTSFAVVENPDPSGSNTDVNNVGAITNNGATFEGIAFELGAPIDLSSEKTIKMDFWSDQALNILLKLEISESEFTEVTVSHSGTGWEELSFNFSASGTYPKLVIFVDGPGTATGTFYFDNVVQEETPIPPCVDETAQSLSAADFNLTFLAEDSTSSILDEGSVLTRISNPDTDNDVNESCFVGQVVRDADSQFANNQIEFDTKLDFNASAGFKLKVWSSTVGTNVLVKIEDKALGNAGPSAEAAAVTTVENGWEELTFDFASGDSDKFDRIVLFFELAQNVSGTYYIDDFMLYERVGDPCTPDATQSLSTTNFNLTFQADPSASVTPDGGVLTVIDNPDFDNDVNKSCKVGEIVRDASLAFANTQIELDTKLDFNSNSGFKLKVWSPTANTNVVVKLEDKALGNSGPSVEIPVTAGAASTWQELTFDFAPEDSDKFDRIVLFFELGQNVAETYYIDDFAIYGSGSGGGGGSTGCSGDAVAATTLPVTFESCESFISGFSSIGDGGVTPSLATNPSASGINVSDNVLRVVRSSGINRWGGVQNSFPAGTIDITTKVFKIKVYSNLNDVTYRFELALDPQTNPVTGNPAPVFRQVSGGANTWTEIEFTFINLPASPSTYNQLVIKPDNPEGSDNQTTSEEQIFYFDDLRLE